MALFQVAPSELEAVLLTHPAVVDAGVFGLPHPLAGELPTALVVRSPGASVTEKDIQDYVKGSTSCVHHIACHPLVQCVTWCVMLLSSLSLKAGVQLAPILVVDLCFPSSSVTVTTTRLHSP